MSAVASFVDRVTPLAPWLVDALRAITKLGQLADNWDGYGSPPIQPAALDSARRLVSAIEMEELPTPSVGPVSGGGIGIVWQIGARELHVEILPDGSAEFLVAAVDPKTRTETTQEGLLPNTDQVRNLVGWLIKG